MSLYSLEIIGLSRGAFRNLFQNDLYKFKDINQMSSNTSLPNKLNTSAVKFDSGKPRPSLLSSISLLEISKVATMGATKYADHNWRKGMKWSRLLDAVKRHLLLWENGEKLDDESKLPHLAHASWGLMALLEYEITSNGENDLYRFGDKNQSSLFVTRNSDVKDVSSRTYT